MNTVVLNAGQANASEVFTEFLIDDEQKYMILNGPAGTGKSTLVESLIENANKRLKMLAVLQGKKSSQLSIINTATTNKAAAVLAAMIHAETRTIHSRLGLTLYQNPRTGKETLRRGKNYEPIYNSLIIIDEASYISEELFAEIDQGTLDCKILLVGDKYQLAPVGQVISVMDDLQCRQAELTEVMRHGGIIAESAANFRYTVQDIMAEMLLKPKAVPQTKFGDILVDGDKIKRVKGAVFKKMVEETFTDPNYKADDARILNWDNTTVQDYNRIIREMIGMPKQLTMDDVLITNKAVMTGGGVAYSADSPVTITEICEEKTLRGITGRFVCLGSPTRFFLPDNPLEIAGLLAKMAIVAKRDRDWSDFYHVKNEWLDLRPNYASTVHKAQGSTYGKVFINLYSIGKCFIPSDVARMMYVAISRASDQVILFGELPPRYGGMINAAKRQTSTC